MAITVRTGGHHFVDQLVWCGRVLARATLAPHSMSWGLQSSCAIWHSISTGPPLWLRALLIAWASSPPVVAVRPSPWPSAAFQALIKPA